LIKFKVGQRSKAWQGNCIAIGLAGGFIEPLESTGLYLCDMAAVMLAEHFPETDDMMEAMSFRFNRLIYNRYLEILDFINMHYCLSRRTDTAFWREVQKPERITDRLKAKFEYWKIKPPSASDFEDQYLPGFSGALQASPVAGTDARTAIDTAGIWNHESYEAIMYGMHFCGAPLASPQDGADRPIVHPAIIERLKQAQKKLPPHEYYLHRVLGMPEFKYSGYQPPGWAEDVAKPH
jgi:tryptophan halogenase